MGHYVPCRQIGPVSTLGDQRGDVRTSTSGLVSNRHIAVPRDVDLRAVGVARGKDEICADFETAAPIRRPFGAELRVIAHGRRDSFALALVEVSFRAPGAPRISIDPAADPAMEEPVSTSQVAVVGTRLSVVVRRDELEPQARWILDDFDWSATSISVDARPGYPAATVKWSDSVPEDALSTFVHYRG